MWSQVVGWRGTGIGGWRLVWLVKPAWRGRLHKVGLGSRCLPPFGCVEANPLAPPCSLLPGLCWAPSPVIVRSTLIPFDCSRTGDVYIMDAEPTIVCGQRGGPNARMRVVSIVSMVVFVVGFPAAVAIFLWRYRAAIHADQTLRERGEGESPLTNPHFQVQAGPIGSSMHLARTVWALC